TALASPLKRYRQAEVFLLSSPRLAILGRHRQPRCRTVVRATAMPQSAEEQHHRALWHDCRDRTRAIISIRLTLTPGMATGNNDGSAVICGEIIQRYDGGCTVRWTRARHLVKAIIVVQRLR